MWKTGSKDLTDSDKDEVRDVKNISGGAKEKENADSLNVIDKERAADLNAKTARMEDNPDKTGASEARGETIVETGAGAGDETFTADNARVEADIGNDAEGDEGKDLSSFFDALKKELEDREKLCNEYLDRLQRTMAEFDNYKKRTAREKAGIYDDAALVIIAAFLPAVDIIERAAAATSTSVDPMLNGATGADADAGSIKEGVELIYKQVKEILQKLNVKRIPGVGEQFDPQYHNAVMHVEDDGLEKNVVAEVFQVGYLYKDRVVRYSMVKVAN
jgi:molecular chaperone GrpE